MGGEVKNAGGTLSPLRRCGVAARGRGSGGWSSAAVGLFAATALLAACSFEYSGAGASPEALIESIPQTELADVTHTIVRDGRVVAEFHAQHVRNFPRAARTELEQVSYSEYDGNGNVVTTGSFQRAVYHSEREDAELAGAIRLRSRSQDVRLEAETLRWDDARHRLTSGAGATVQISRDDGSQVSGTGLEVDVRRKTVRFSGPVTGTLVTESTEEE